MPQFFTWPKSTPTSNGQPLPEAPNRPLGQNWLDDAVDMILGGIGVDNPLSPTASKATQIGGMIGAAVPILGAAKIIKPAKTAVAAAEEAIPGFTAYHGSPHNFEKFDLSKIGTGEGAQAYGHGLYFADNEKTAQTYRDMLSGKTASGAPLNWDDPAQVASMRLHQFSGDPAAAIEWISQRRPNPSVSAQNAKSAEFTDRMIDAIRRGQATAPVDAGKMYQVRIKADPSQFLDWDGPLKEQPTAVHAAIGYQGEPSPDEVNAVFTLAKKRGVDPASMPEYKALEARLDAARELERQYPTGEHVYSDLRMKAQPEYESADQWEASKAAATQQLRAAGIPGIKYLDQGSRAAGEGSRNYVVFDDQIVDILKKYGLALPFAGAAAALQQSRSTAVKGGKTGGS